MYSRDSANMPANILNLPQYAVKSVDHDDHDYHINAEVKAPPGSCPSCGSTSLVGFGRREQVVKDLPMHGRRVGIYINTRRMLCRSCNKTFSEILPEVNERRSMTKRLVAWIGKQAIKRTFASIADEVGVTEGTIRGIFKDYITDTEKTIRFETPKWMGIDEIHLIKPRCVIANIRSNTIVDLLPNRDKKTVVNYLYGLQDKARVQFVAMDMWAPYRDAVQLVLPDALIVIDKFHVVRMANDAVERIRKSLREKLTTKQRRGLMHDRFVLLKRERDLNDRERLLLDGWTVNYPDLGAAYRLKEEFYGIYETAVGSAQALNQYEAWYQAITPETYRAFSDLIRAWSNWKPYILNYFDQPITNAYTESLNNLIRSADRLGRGYSFEALRAKILFAEGAFKYENNRPKFERKPSKSRRPLIPPDEAIGYDLPDRLAEEASTQEPQNYGVDISTLTRMIELGEL